jgi:transposase-like protein
MSQECIRLIMFLPPERLDVRGPLDAEVEMRSKADARLKRSRAVELAKAGYTYDEIAREVGFSHRGSAYRAVRKALDTHEAASVGELRALENDRLDSMLAALWPAIELGDVRAIDTALRVTDRRIRLNGLNTEAGVTTRAAPRMLISD